MPLSYSSASIRLPGAIGALPGIAEQGFDLKAYSAGRDPSDTRKRIFEIAGSGIVCINTNVFWQVSNRMKGLRKRKGNLPWLFERLPNGLIVIVHGMTAQREYKRLSKTHSQMPRDEEVIFCDVHLSGMGARKSVVVRHVFDKAKQQIEEALKRSKP
jgi:hypothetical protein